MEKKSKKVSAGEESSHLRQPATFRLSHEAVEMLQKLSAREGVNKTSIVEMAIRRMYRSQIDGGKEK